MKIVDTGECCLGRSGKTAEQAAVGRQEESLVRRTNQCSRQQVVGGSELERQWKALRWNEANLAADMQHVLNAVSSHA
jgi:hypothetical protein